MCSGRPTSALASGLAGDEMRAGTLLRKFEMRLDRTVVRRSNEIVCEKLWINVSIVSCVNLNSLTKREKLTPPLHL